jgi:outer membrane protein OmpA-like peptidoglycan-associated protein
MAKRKPQAEDFFAVFFDMMTGLLFVFIIALVAYMLAFNDKHSQEMKLRSSLKDITFLQSDLVRTISKELRRYGIVHKVDIRAGVISFSDPSLGFESGQWTLTENQQPSYSIIQKVLQEYIPCYSSNPPADCRPDLSGKLQALVIEGHTDSVPFLGQSSVSDNMDLSYQRAKSVYSQLTNGKLKSLVNSDHLPLMLAAGFGSSRPISNNLNNAAKSENRRIDIRFVMTPLWKSG